MQNIQIGDRVVDRTSNKVGVVESFYKPLSFGYKSSTKAVVKLDNGNVIHVEPHNLSLAEGYEEEKFDPVGINAQSNPNDKADALTPAKRGRKKKSDSIDDIIESASDDPV